MFEKTVTTIFYQTEKCKTICSIEIFQKTLNDKSLSIICPDPTVTSDLFKFKSQSTAINIFLLNIENSQYSDYINSIAMCMIKAKIPIDYLVSSNMDGNTLVYSPQKDYLSYSYLTNYHAVASLKQDCLDIFERILNMLE